MVDIIVHIVADIEHHMWCQPRIHKVL